MKRKTIIRILLLTLSGGMIALFGASWVLKAVMRFGMIDGRPICMLPEKTATIAAKCLLGGGSTHMGGGGIYAGEMVLTIITLAGILIAATGIVYGIRAYRFSTHAA